MQSGKLDKQIVLKSYSQTVDTFGAPTEAYTDLPPIWADVTDLRGTQLFTAQQMNSGITTKFRIRYRSDINAKWRVGYNGLEYDIIGIPMTIGRNEALEFNAKARDV